MRMRSERQTEGSAVLRATAPVYYVADASVDGGVAFEHVFVPSVECVGEILDYVTTDVTARLQRLSETNSAK